MSENKPEYHHETRALFEITTKVSDLSAEVRVLASRLEGLESQTDGKFGALNDRLDDFVRNTDALRISVDEMRRDHAIANAPGIRITLGQAAAVIGMVTAAVTAVVSIYAALT